MAYVLGEQTAFMVLILIMASLFIGYRNSKVKLKWLSPVRLSVTPWTVALQVPPSMGFSRQEYWSGFPFPSPEDFPNTGIEAGSPAL